VTDDGGGVSWLTSEEHHAWAGLMQMQGQLLGRLGRELAARSGLSLADYGVLVTLTEADGGRMRANELGRQLGWEKSRLSHHVARMVARVLVVRERCPSDARGLLVAATEEGRRSLGEAAPGHVDAVRRWFVDRLTTAQLATLADIADAVRAGLAEGECGE
jgi:DNA-binding MarR family transcriptional regulator